MPPSRPSIRLVSMLGLLLAGCDPGPLAPGAAPTMAERVSLKIQSFPSSLRLGMGSNALLFLDDAREIREVVWISSAPGVASVTPMPEPSPCGSRCAWLSAGGCGRARIEAYVCLSTEAVGESTRRAVAPPRRPSPAGSSRRCSRSAEAWLGFAWAPLEYD